RLTSCCALRSRHSGTALRIFPSAKASRAPAAFHKSGIKDRGRTVSLRKLPAHVAYSVRREDASGARNCPSDDGPNHMISECVDCRLVPMRQCGAEYRFALHRSGNDAENSGQGQERRKSLAEALTA